MSSILDALKKSEAERQRGTPPTLDSPIVFQRRPAPPRRRPVWILPVLALAALAGAWYAGLLPWPAPTATPAPAADVAADSDAQPPVADAAGTAPDPSAIAAVPPSVEVPAAPPAGPAPESTPAAPAPAVEPRRGFYGGGARMAAPADPTVADAGAGAAPAPDPAAPAAAVAPPPVAAPPVPPVDAQVAPAAPPVVPVDPAAAPSTPAPDPAAAPLIPAPDPAAAAAVAPADGIPSIHELPFAVRRELPELKVTMHLYSPDPARRLVLLNGVRARDGDTLDGGLEVVAIRAADIVLRFQGTEFVLPLRG